MNIVLIGYRGTGKSTVGKVLAKRLGLAVVSTDAEIVRRAGQTIPEIVTKHGWDYFRDLESAVCQELATREGLVIDTGGGAILRPQNVEHLKKTGTLFWLTASVATIAMRIGGASVARFQHRTQGVDAQRHLVVRLRRVGTERFEPGGDVVLERALVALLPVRAEERRHPREHRARNRHFLGRGEQVA